MTQYRAPVNSAENQDRLNQFLDNNQAMLKRIGFDFNRNGVVENNEFGRVFQALEQSPLVILNVPANQRESYLRDTFRRATAGAERR